MFEQEDLIFIAFMNVWGFGPYYNEGSEDI